MGHGSIASTEWSLDINQIRQWHMGQDWKQIQSVQTGDIDDTDNIIQTGTLYL